jgi:ARP2/3 complex 16 kDa subunit (p16-Arc)
MKYLYKGMGLPGWGDVSGSVLLGWHEKVRHYLDHYYFTFYSIKDVTFAADGGGGHWLYCTSYDRPENCIISQPVVVDVRFFWHIILFLTHSR